MTNEADLLIKYKELEDQRMSSYLTNHNANLMIINEMNIDDLSSFQLAKMEYLYSKCQLYAYLIASHYRKEQKYHEALAEQAQADCYEATRMGKNGEFKTSTDAQYLSRKAKGKELEIASKHDGDCSRWRGIAEAYGSSINSIKDMIKSFEKENHGGV